MAGRIRGEQIKDDSITGQDINESTLILPHLTTHKYTATSSNSVVLVRFNSAGSNTMGGSQVNNKFVAPARGRLNMVKFRSTGTPGQTEIALMRIHDGTENFGSPGAPIKTVGINVSSTNTVYTATFPDDIHNTFAAGDVLGIRISPVNNHGNVDITCIWDLDFSS